MSRPFQHGWIAITRQGQRKLFRTYVEACDWLDSAEPSNAGFVTEDEPNLSYNTFVRHAD